MNQIFIVPSYAKWVQFVLRRRNILLITTMLVLSISGLLWHMNNQATAQIKTTAIHNARLYSEAIAEFRTLYTSEVVIAAEKHGMTISHDYAQQENAIPLPATMSILLGKRIGELSSGVISRLYSPYPFPWRKNNGGGLPDQFARDAWAAFESDPSSSFIHFENINGKESIRYAVPDLMRASCVQCHNNHPDTPKSNWKENDVRGVLEIILPVEQSMLLAQENFQQSLMISSAIFLLIVTSIVIIVDRLRKESEFSQKLAQYTEDVNKQLEQEIVERKKAEEKLFQISRHDSLTLLANRRCFDEVIQREWKRASRNKEVISLLMLDVDYFKMYNDTYGHQAGDECLNHIADILKRVAMRPIDLAARYGGEEFMLLLPDTENKGAQKVAEIIINDIRSLNIKHNQSQVADRVTVSIGVVTTMPNQKLESIEKLISLADEALYIAKDNGRNRFAFLDTTQA